MKRKMLPKKDAPNGLYLYCNTHKRWYKNDNVVKCKCDLKYKAKIHIPGTKNSSKIKTIEAEDCESAIQQFQEFKRTLKNNEYQNVKVVESTSKPIMLVDCISEFLDFKKDVGVPFHMKHNLTKGTIRQIEYALELFCASLLYNGIDPENLKFSAIDSNDKISGMFAEYLVTVIGTKNKTYNNHLVNVKSFMNYMTRKHYTNLHSPFTEMKFKPVMVKTKAIDLDDFYSMLQIVNEENGVYYEEQKIQRKKGLMTYRSKRNYYRPWLIDAFLLGLFTGGRKEETASMKWRHIVTDREGNMSYILVVDYKATRLLNLDVNTEEVVEKYVEVVPEFEKLLYSMGYEEKKGSNEYILANDENWTRDYLMDFVSKAFSHYYKKLNLDENLNFKHLRKTYFTGNAILHGIEMASKLGGHQSARVTLKHYIDQRMLLKAKSMKNRNQKNGSDNNQNE